MANRADFAPELGALKSLRPFVFWAQTTLPTVFDDSLSYYEVLTKLCKMVNTMLENEDTNAENIAALAEAYQELEDFTNNYFENLDVTQEINDKLDELVADGTIGGYVVDRATTLVNNYLYGEDGESGKNAEIEELISKANADITQALTTFNTNSSQALNTFNTNSTQALRDFRNDANDALDAIPDTVEAWLEQNFTNPQSTPLDATLSVESAAAQAKATGEAIEGAIAVAMGNSHWNYRITDVDYTNSVLANRDGSNAQVTSEAVGYDHSLHIASVTPGEAYTISCVGRITGPSKFAPAYAFASLTYDLQDNPVYVIRDIYPRSLDDQTVQYEIVRNKQIIIPNYQTGEPVNTLLLMGFAEIAVTPSCAQLVNDVDTTLTSTALPAQGKATGDALETKLPWPVSGGNKDLGTAGYGLVTNADGTTSWQEVGGDYDEEIENLQNDVVDLKSAIYSADDVTIYPVWERGSLDSNGADVVEDSGKQYRTGFLENINLVSLPEMGYRIFVYEYSSDRTYVKRTEKYSGDVAPVNPLIRVVINANNWGVLNPETLNNYIRFATQNPIVATINSKTAQGVYNATAKSGNIVGGWIRDGYYMDVSGTIKPVGAGSDWCYSDYMPVEPETTYHLISFVRKNKLVDNCYINYFDATMGWLKGEQKIAASEVATPADASWMVISLSGRDSYWLYITKSSTLPKFHKSKGQTSLYEAEMQKPLREILCFAKDGINTLGELNTYPLYPHCSKWSYIAAFYQGFNGLCMHIVKTSDGEFVLSHENNLYPLAKNDDGTALSSPYNIQDHTLAELKSIDIGYDYGAMYRHTRVQTLEDGLKIARAYGLTPIVEMTFTLDDSDIEKVAEIVKLCGFNSGIGFHSYYANKLRLFKAAIPKAMLFLDAVGTESYVDSIISDAIGLKAEDNLVFIACQATSSNNLTESQIKRLAENNICYSLWNPSSEPDGFAEFMNSGTMTQYATAFETQALPAWKMLVDSIES